MLLPAVPACASTASASTASASTASASVCTSGSACDSTASVCASASVYASGSGSVFCLCLLLCCLCLCSACACLQAGSRTLLLDEDTCATNFMIRDHRMQRLIAKQHEPITPFIYKVPMLTTTEAVSTTTERQLCPRCSSCMQTATCPRSWLVSWLVVGWLLVCGLLVCG